MAIVLSGGTLAALAAAGAFVGVGAAGFFTAWSRTARERATRTWPTVDGTVVVSRLATEEYTSRDQQGYDVASVQMTAVVTTKYVVDGKMHQRTGITLAEKDVTSSSATAKGWMDRYPVGAKVPVHYDPADPARSYLESGTPAGAVFFFVFGGFFLFMGIGAFVLVLAAS